MLWQMTPLPEWNDGAQGCCLLCILSSFVTVYIGYLLWTYFK